MSGDRLEVSVSFDERRGYVAGSACRAPGRLRVLLRGGGPSLRWEAKSNVGIAIGESKPTATRVKAGSSLAALALVSEHQY
jgi:hypothetical protein